MNIKMAGIDYHRAKLDERAVFSFGKAAAAEAEKMVCDTFGADGCVILSTCNRTELWISGETESTPFEILCELKQVDKERYRDSFLQLEGEEALWYLLKLSCGMCSQIFGEDQILTKVKEALVISRQAGCADAVLETLFRTAVTAAKRVKTQTVLTKKDHSVANAAVELLKNKWGDLSGLPCLVIGNGEMGRLTAALLLQNGCQVKMTLRQYKTKDVVIPGGCGVIDYDRRLEALGWAKVVISATLSPHYTLRYEEAGALLRQKGGMLIDLAVPRDIDPKIGELPGVTCYDMDALGCPESEENRKEREKAEGILKEYQEEFLRWYGFRSWVPVMEEISRAVSKDFLGRMQKPLLKLGLSPDEDEQFRAALSASSVKAVSKLLFGLKEELEQENWEECISALHRSAKKGTQRDTEERQDG